MITSSAAAHDRPDWRDVAACRGADPELFFPDGDIKAARAQVKGAKLICRGCPVRAVCLSWALASGQEAGIWGGLTEDERRRGHHRFVLRRDTIGAGSAWPGDDRGLRLRRPIRDMVQDR